MNQIVNHMLLDEFELFVQSLLCNWLACCPTTTPSQRRTLTLNRQCLCSRTPCSIIIIGSKLDQKLINDMCSKACNSFYIAFLRLEYPVKYRTNDVLITDEIYWVALRVLDFFHIPWNRRVYDFFEERDHQEVDTFFLLANVKIFFAVGFLEWLLAIFSAAYISYEVGWVDRFKESFEQFPVFFLSTQIVVL